MTTPPRIYVQYILSRNGQILCRDINICFNTILTCILRTPTYLTLTQSGPDQLMSFGGPSIKGSLLSS